MMKTLAPGIEMFENVVPNIEYLNNLIGSDEVEWQSGAVTNGQNNSIDSQVRSVSTHNMYHDDGVSDSKIFNMIYSHVRRCMDLYAEKYDIPVSHNYEKFQLLKYNAGQFFKRHSDGGPGIQRSLSVVMYLNDDYHGGEISFDAFNLSVKAPKNSLIIFPSTPAYSHEAVPVKSGIKLAMVTFIA